METKIKITRRPVPGDYLRYKMNGVTKTFTFVTPAVHWNAPSPNYYVRVTDETDQYASIGTNLSAYNHTWHLHHSIKFWINQEFYNSSINNQPNELYLTPSEVTGFNLGIIVFRDTANAVFTDFEFSSDYASFGGNVDFFPSSIAFVHTQSGILPTNSISISGDNWEIVGKPNFVLSSSNAGVTVTPVIESTGNYQKITGSGDATIVIGLGSYYDGDATFTPAELAGNFQVNKSGAALGTIAYTVQVNKVESYFTNPYPANQLAFTLDDKYIEVFSAASKTYFQIDLEIKIYDFFTNLEKTETVKQKLVLFNGKSKINIGRLVHRLMANFPNPNANSYQYKYATVVISHKEKKLSDDSVFRSGTTSAIKFVAGLSRGITNIGFLDFNLRMNRVTTNGFAYLNMVAPSGQFELKTYKNGNLLNTKALPATQEKIICEKVSFDTFNQGDLIEYQILPVGGVASATKSFMVFPESFHSTMLVWENEFLLQSAIECTGTASIKSDFEFQSQKVYQNFVEKINYLSSTKEVKLNINTGWLMQTDVDTVESLMRSKRVWLTKENETIALRPISKSIVNQDLERELIDFTIEFIINRKYDEETYTL